MGVRTSAIIEPLLVLHPTAAMSNDSATVSGGVAPDVGTASGLGLMPLLI
jgi:hypothetical protein